MWIVGHKQTNQCRQKHNLLAGGNNKLTNNSSNPLQHAKRRNGGRCSVPFPVDILHNVQGYQHACHHQVPADLNIQPIAAAAVLVHYSTAIGWLAGGSYGHGWRMLTRTPHEDTEPYTVYLVWQTTCPKNTLQLTNAGCQQVCHRRLADWPTYRCKNSVHIVFSPTQMYHLCARLIRIIAASWTPP